MYPDIIRWYYTQIIALKQEPRMQKFPGGSFLIVEISEPIWDDVEPGIQWEISAPNTIVMARMGMTPGGLAVFQYDDKLYLRELRKVVEGGTHREHVDEDSGGWPWGWKALATSGSNRYYYARLALKPYTGEYKRLRADPPT